MPLPQLSTSQKRKPRPKDVTTYDLIILGSGIAGLAAARLAEKHNKSVLVVDKGRRLGGRVSTRRKNGFLFNHGAQFVTAWGNEFSALLADARNAGSLKDWRINPGKTVQIGAPSMRDLPQFMARGIEIRQQIEVTSIAHIGPYIGFFDDTGLIASGRQAIVSAPAPQSARLLKNVYPDLAATAQLTSYDPCWTIMLSLETDIRRIGMSQDQLFPMRNEAAGIGLAVPETLRFADGPALNTSEPSALTIQASGAWSQKHLDDDPQFVIARLCKIWTETAGQPLPSIVDASAHLWLYAKVTRAADDDAKRHSNDGKMAIAGDWLGGSRVEHAFDSGVKAYIGLC
jgi:renalase